MPNKHASPQSLVAEAQGQLFKVTTTYDPTTQQLVLDGDVPTAWVRQIVMEALLSPRVPGTTPTLVSADRQMINGLAKAAKSAYGADIKIDISRLGRLQECSRVLP